MTNRVCIIEGSRFTNYVGFVAEVNRVFGEIIQSTWRGGLDSFNDYLSWPFSDTGEGYTLVWTHSGLSRQRLGYDETALWYQDALSKCEDSNVAFFTQKLAEVERHEGQTLFDWLIEMIEGYPEIELRLQ